MFKSVVEKIIGSYSDREIKRIIPIVDKIESLEDQMRGLSDDALRGKTDEFKQRLPLYARRQTVCWGCGISVSS